MSETRKRSMTWLIQCMITSLIGWLAITESVILARKHLFSATSLRKPPHAANAVEKKLLKIVRPGNLLAR